MAITISKENHVTALVPYHGFHDAEIRSLHFEPDKADGGYFHGDITLVCKNHESSSVETVLLSLANISDFKWAYDKRYDYPHIRDEISIGHYEDLFYIDFGSACQPRNSPEEYRSADSYFVCEGVTLDVMDV